MKRDLIQYLSITMLLIVMVSLFSFEAAYVEKKNELGYDFSLPDRSLTLPDTLREISGLTIIDSTTFACIQDENGILFFYDLTEDKIKKQYKFNFDGDYEGITRVDRKIYVLRSDGTIFEISDYTSTNFRLTSYTTGIPADNNEGLCYDVENRRLLIACKGKIGKGHEFKDKRAIYGFDLQSNILSDKPVFDISVGAIEDFAIKNKIALPSRTRKIKGQSVTEPFIKLNTSEICIHPLTKKLFLLSASDFLLFVFNMNGDVEHIEKLDPAVFNKAEGITFDENGNMLISNEAQNKRPTLLYFKYRPG